MPSIFFDAGAIIFVVLALVLSYALYYKNEAGKERINSVAKFTQLLVWVGSLGYITVILSNLVDIGKVGRALHFVLMVNLYVGLINIGSRIYNRFYGE